MGAPSRFFTACGMTQVKSFHPWGTSHRCQPESCILQNRGFHCLLVACLCYTSECIIPDHYSASGLFTIAKSAQAPFNHRMASSSRKVWCRRVFKPSDAKFAQHEIAEHPDKAINQAKSRRIVTSFSWWCRASTGKAQASKPFGLGKPLSKCRRGSWHLGRICQWSFWSLTCCKRCAISLIHCILYAKSGGPHRELAEQVVESEISHSVIVDFVCLWRGPVAAQIWVLFPTQENENQVEQQVHRESFDGIKPFAERLPRGVD